MKVLSLLQGQLKKEAVGTLVLGEKNSFREIFFEKDSVYLCGDHYSGRLDIATLVETGVYPNSVSADQLDAVLSTTDLTSESLPQVLVNHGYIEDGDLDRLAPPLLTEEIIELLLESGDSVHFQEKRVPEEILDSTCLSARYPIRLEDLIRRLESHLETVRTAQAVLPSREEVFVVTAEGMAHAQDHAGDFALQRLFGLIDGFRNLDRLIEDSRFYDPFLLKLLVDCLEREFLKKTVLPELSGVRPDELEEEEAQEYLPHFKNAVKYSVNALTAREKLAQLYERLGNEDGAVLQYNFIGDTLFRMKKPSKAIGAYQRALEVKPGDLMVTDKITRIYQDSAEQELLKDHVDDAIRLLENALRTRPDDQLVFQRLAEVLTEHRRLRELTELCDRIIAHAKKEKNHQIGVAACRQALANLPDHPLFQKKLVNVYLDFGRSEEAAREMAVLATIYAGKGQTDRALDLADKIKLLKAKSPEVTRIYRALADRLGIRTTRRNYNAAGVGLLLGLSVVFSAYQVLGYLVWRDIRQAGDTFAHAAAETHSSAVASSDGVGPERVSLVYDPRSEEGQNLHLAQRYEAFVRQFPFSFWRGEAETTGRLCREAARALSRAREHRKASILERARLHATEGDLASVRSTIEPLLELDDGDTWKSRALRVLEGVQGVDRSARDLRDHARRLEARGQWREAWGVWHRLAQEFPDSTILGDLTVPVLVESLPEGAEVVDLDPRASPGAIGRTPLVLRMEPGAGTSVRLSMPDHEPLEARVFETDGRHCLLVVPRREATTLEVQGRLSVDPVITRDQVIIATNSGVVEGFSISSGASRWTLPREEIHRLVGPPLATDEGVYLIWNDRRIQLLEKNAGAEPRRGATEESSVPVLARTALRGLARTRGVPLECGSLVVGTSRKRLGVFRRLSLRRVSEIRLEALPIHLDRLSDRAVLVTTEAGDVVAMDVPRGKVLWRKQLGKLPTVPPRRVGESVALLTAERDLLLLEPATGLPRAVQPAPSSGAVGIAPESDAVVVLYDDGKLATIDPLTGRTRRATTVGSNASFLRVVGDRVVIVLDEGHWIRVFDPTTLAPLWEARPRYAVADVHGNESHLAVVESMSDPEGAGGRLRIHLFDNGRYAPATREITVVADTGDGTPVAPPGGDGPAPSGSPSAAGVADAEHAAADAEQTATSPPAAPGAPTPAPAADAGSIR